MKGDKRMDTQDANATVKQLRIGILIICALIMVFGGIISYCISSKWISFVLGVLLGGVIAEILATHMAHTIANALLQDSDGATKYMRKMAVLRSLMMGATIFLALTFSNIFNLIGVLLGILALKFSAYAQPLTSKYIIKFYSKGR